MHPRFAKRIAMIYSEVYRLGGFAAAGKYADRVLKGDPKLQAEIREAIDKQVEEASPPPNKGA